MIFDSLKILKACNKAELLVEEVFLLQTVYDFQQSSTELNSAVVAEIEKNYLAYFKRAQFLKGEGVEIRIPWKQIIDKLIKEGWLEDDRINKNKFKLSELHLGKKFKETLELAYTDEELFEQTKDFFPTFYNSQGPGGALPNKNYNPKEENEIFKSFKKVVLAGNKRENWIEFEYITKALFENGEKNSFIRFDRYINTFRNNVADYRKML